MTETNKHKVQRWSEDDLPVLTEVEDHGFETPIIGVDVPDFDFGQELDQIQQQITPETPAGLEFPPELVDVVDAPASPQAIDFNSLPSLDLSDEHAPVATTAAAEEFEFELEPRQPLSLRELESLSDASLEKTLPGQAEVPPALTDALPELSLDDVMGAPLVDDKSDDTLSELTLDDVLPLLAPLADPEPPATPALASEPLPGAAVELCVDSVPDLSQLATDPDHEAFASAVAAPLPLTDTLADDLTPPTLADTLMDDAWAVPESTAESDDAISPARPADAQSPAPLAADMALAAEAAMAVEVAQKGTTGEAAPTAKETIPELALDAIVEPAADGGAITYASLADELLAHDPLAGGDMPVFELPRSEPVQTAAADAEIDLTSAAPAGEDTAASTPSAAAEGVQSISLDSLPRGVLGGGLAMAQAEDQAPSMEDLIRVAERTLAAEPKKLVTPVFARHNEAERSVIPIDRSFEPARISLPEPVGLASPPPEDSRPVEIINITGLAASQAAAAMPQLEAPAAQLRKSYVTVVDENMLLDALYQKILPKMRVELSLWLQDALQQQAKHLMSGAMHQLKEDYEMSFGETLKESLRQAIAEMAREEQQGSGGKH